MQSSGAGYPGELALVITGGGARAAYQAGVLRGIARHYPDTRFNIIHGVSAGAINALFIAASTDPLPTIVEALADNWRSLQLDDIIATDAMSLSRPLGRWGLRMIPGGRRVARDFRGFMNTAPLRQLLQRMLAVDRTGEIAGVGENLRRGRHSAVAVTTLDYATGQTVNWIDGEGIEAWSGPHRRTVKTRFSIDHVMASAALPLLFPAVRLAGSWHGDGGVRLTAPLSTAMHLGAQRILAISTSYMKTPEEEDRPQTCGYPPPAQILGQLVNSIFLDVVNEDALRLERSNALLRQLPEELRNGYRIVDLLVIRPSEDLGLVASEYEPRLPRTFRFLTRSLGTRETSEADFLSLLMFEPNYLRRVIEIGERDVETRIAEIDAVLAPPAVRPLAQVS